MLDKISRNGYESTGFDAFPLTQDKEQDLFTIKTRYPIPLAVFTDYYTWAKYGCHILPSTILLNQIENFNTHGLYCNALQQLLRTDLDGNLSTSLNPPTKAKLDKYVSTFFRGKSKTTTLGDNFDKFMKNPESRELFGAKKGDCIVCKDTSSLLIHQFICQEVSWSMLPFSWRSIYLFFEVHPLSQKHHCSWVNWRNSITCTHCNVISLGYDCHKRRHSRGHCIHSS